jgi:hypothetical protein
MTEAVPSFTINFATNGARRCGDLMPEHSMADKLDAIARAGEWTR